MTSHIDVLILTNVVACAPCRNRLLLKEHSMAMFSTATLFWDVQQEGEIRVNLP